jgi:hypothetical protein
MDKVSSFSKCVERNPKLHKYFGLKQMSPMSLVIQQKQKVLTELVLKVKGWKKKPDVHNTVCDSIAKGDKTSTACLNQFKDKNRKARANDVPYIRAYTTYFTMI